MALINSETVETFENLEATDFAACFEIILNSQTAAGGQVQTSFALPLLPL